MLNNINSNLTFKERIVFKVESKKVKEYYPIAMTQFTHVKPSTKKNKAPSWFIKLIFGIKKQTKLPS